MYMKKTEILDHLSSNKYMYMNNEKNNVRDECKRVLFTSLFNST